MGYDLNFQLLGQPVDIGGAITTGYQHGRQMRQQAQQDSAFAMLARDPNSTEARALLTASGRPDLARQFRTWGIEDRRDAFRRGILGGDTALPSVGAPTASAFAPAVPPAVAPAPANVAPVAAGSPPVAVSAPPAAMAPPAPVAAPAASQGLNMDMMRQYFAEDPDGARELLTTWNSLTEAQQEIATRRFTAAIPVLTTALSVPYEQRRAFIQSHAAELTQNGWSTEEIAGFDPTDTNTQLLIRRGLPLAQQRDFFAPIDGGPGQVYRSRFGLGVEAANPSPPRTETYYDEDGNEIRRSIPGTPALGPGANLFGAGAQGGQVQPAAPQVGEVRRGYRYNGGDPASPASWERVGGAPTSSTPDLDNWNAAGRGGSQGPRTFP